MFVFVPCADPEGKGNGITEPRGRRCPMQVGPSRSFSLRDNHLRTPSLRQNSPEAAIWGSPVPSFWTPRAVQWLDEFLLGLLEVWNWTGVGVGVALVATGNPSQQRPKDRGNTRFPVAWFVSSITRSAEPALPPQLFFSALFAWLCFGSCQAARVGGANRSLAGPACLKHCGWGAT